MLLSCLSEERRGACTIACYVGCRHPTARAQRSLQDSSPLQAVSPSPGPRAKCGHPESSLPCRVCTCTCVQYTRGGRKAARGHPSSRAGCRPPCSTQPAIPEHALCTCKAVVQSSPDATSVVKHNFPSALFWVQLFLRASVGFANLCSTAPTANCWKSGPASNVCFIYLCISVFLHPVASPSAPACQGLSASSLQTAQRKGPLGKN